MCLPKDLDFLLKSDSEKIVKLFSGYLESVRFILELLWNSAGRTSKSSEFSFSLVESIPTVSYLSDPPELRNWIGKARSLFLRDSQHIDFHWQLEIPGEEHPGSPIKIRQSSYDGKEVKISFMKVKDDIKESNNFEEMPDISQGNRRQARRLQLMRLSFPNSKAVLCRTF
ncbi:unnamed protein product [Caretta caretta]